MQFYYVKPLKLEIYFLQDQCYPKLVILKLIFIFSPQKAFFQTFFFLITASALNFNTIDIIYICLLTICVCHCALQSKIHLLSNPEPIFVPLGALLPWLRTHAINDSKMYLPPVHLSYLKFPSCPCILIIYFSLFSIP